jgi:hypothetical protein
MKYLRRSERRVNEGHEVGAVGCVKQSRGVRDVQRVDTAVEKCAADEGL